MTSPKCPHCNGDLEQVFESIKKCFASNFGERVMAYKIDLYVKALTGRSEQELKDVSVSYGHMTAIVQLMVDASAAGVGLSVDPATREEVCSTPDFRRGQAPGR